MIMSPMGLGTKIDCADETTSNLNDRLEDVNTESRLSNNFLHSVPQTAVFRLSGVMLHVTCQVQGPDKIMEILQILYTFLY
jgi:hypothetical protein